MNRALSRLALGVSLALLAFPSDVLAGGRGGGAYRGGGGYGGGGAGGGYRGGGGYGGGYGGAPMGHTPSFSQPRPPMGQSGSYGGASGYGNRSQGMQYPGAAGAGYANRNQGVQHPGAAGAAAGAGYSNRNQGVQYPGAAGAAAGAGYANRNQGVQYPGAAGAVAGAGYAYNHSGAGYGYWGGNYYSGWGAAGMGLGYASGVGAWGVGSPMYGWGYSGYSNPYYGGSGGVAQTAVAQPADAQATAAGPAYDYSQPISTTAAPPDPTVAGQASTAYDQAREAFKAGDYARAIQLDQQALSQTPNDDTLHEFLALAYFAQGQYRQAAGPLYAVLSVRPGWDWTTLSGMYPDIDTYTRQLRALEADVRANPASAADHFVLAYHYLVQGHDPNAIGQLKEVVRLQPNDTLSAQLIARSQPAGGSQPPPAETAAAPAASTGVEGKLPGSWTASPAADTKIALTIQDDGAFTWTAAATGKPPMKIAGKSTLANGILTLAATSGQSGALVGQVAWKDADHFTFRIVGAPASDPGLTFAR